MVDCPVSAANKRGPMSKPERIGLLGGTFDPIHYGHLRAAEEIRQIHSLSWVEFLPARIPPHKTDRPMTDISHRLSMIQLALAGNPAFRVSEVEASREGKSYLVDTLEGYRRQYPEQISLFFIMGMDSFREIATWHRYPELFTLAHFLVISRPGYPRPLLSEVVSHEVAASFLSPSEDTSVLEHKSGHCVYFHETTLLAISASAIRECIHQEKDPRYLLPEEVRQYILQHRLYNETRDPY